MIETVFGPNGHYSAHTEAAYWALYHCPDDDTPLKNYAVAAVGPDGVASGEIAFVWLNGTPTVRMGAMTSIEFLDPDHVTIEIWDRGRYGPVSSTWSVLCLEAGVGSADVRRRLHQMPFQVDVAAQPAPLKGRRWERQVSRATAT